MNKPTEPTETMRQIEAQQREQIEEAKKSWRRGAYNAWVKDHQDVSEADFLHLAAYVVNGTYPGPLLRAVLNNDLSGAVEQTTDIERLAALVRMTHRLAPVLSWNHRSTSHHLSTPVDRWILHRGLDQRHRSEIERSGTG